MAAAALKKSGVVVPKALPLRRRIAAAIVIVCLRLFMKSWRYKWVDAELCLGTQGPVIFCCWHNRLALSMATYDKFVREKWPAAGLAAMISASRDGGMLAAVVSSFGVVPIRGSTSRRGPQALLEATTWVKKNHGIAITPDGPRGPVYRVQEGIILLAQLTGCPIIPTSNYVRWKICLRSWDRFQIPLPFAHCDLRYGDPIWVPREASDEERERLRQQLQDAMVAITRD